jgi:CheY-like chemotaxis protein
MTQPHVSAGTTALLRQHAPEGFAYSGRAGCFPTMGRVPSPLMPLPRCRILVVDDHEDTAAMLGLLLTLIGHHTQVAHDGLEALATGAAFRPDVVLLDLNLPGLSGYEVARKLRELPWGREVTLVAVTAMDQEPHRLESRRSGFDAHLVKPVDSHTLEALLAALRALRAASAGP